MSLVSKIMPALFVSALLAVPASAAPIAPNAMPVETSSIIEVRNDGHKGKGQGGKHQGGKHHGGKHQGGKHHGNKHHGGQHHGHRHHSGHRHGQRHHHHHSGRWVAGHRYAYAPPGWRYYGARPWDWQTRGCVLVGPLWFCP